jgi:polyisoprenoid-binding protein YceI
MQRHLEAAVLTCCVLAAGAALAAAGRTYKIDPAQSSVFMVMLKAPSAANSFSHDHAFRAPDVTGTLTWDPAAPLQSTVNVVVKTGTIIADEASTRKRMGLEGEATARELTAIDRDMKGPEFLDVERYPTVTFTSTSVARNDDGRLFVTGDFTMHGTTRTVELPVTITTTLNGVIGDGRLVVKQSDYGIKPCVRFLGAVKCADEVTLLLHLVGRP